MRHSVLRRLARRLAVVAVIACLFAASAPAPAGAGPAAPKPPAAASVSGQGMWGWACLGCVTGYLIAGGTTVVGVAIAMAASPELASACVGACINALT